MSTDACVGKDTVPPRRHTHARACFWCRHFSERGGQSACTHPAYGVPTPWREAIRDGQPCGGANAPLWVARHG